MGKLTNEPFLNHFSHKHTLELTNNVRSQSPLLCTACIAPATTQGGAWLYVCKPCGFVLHVSCAQMPRLLTHPSHPYHPLTLLLVPAYACGRFSCDACGLIAVAGGGFSYHCAGVGVCEFDVHASCAMKPLTVAGHVAHPEHELRLAFAPPYGPDKGFSCDVCRQIGTSQWLYRCDRCEFDVHLECAAPNHYNLQHHNSFPAVHPNNAAPHLQHNYSIPGQNSNFGQFAQNGAYPPTPYPPVVGPGNMNQYSRNVAFGGPNKPNGPIGNNGYVQQNGPIGTNGPVGPNGQENMIVNAMVQGFVEGAAQQVGQTLVQSMMDGGGGGGGDAADGGSGGGGFGGGVSVISIGSSVLGGLFGGGGGDSESQ